MSTATLHQPTAAQHAVWFAPPGFRVVAFGPTGADVLALAANLLPEVSSRVPLSGDIHVALVEALRRLGAADRHHRLRLADEARDMFASYLVATGQAAWEGRESVTVPGWVLGQNLDGVRVALAAAARFWRAELGLSLSDVGQGG